MLSDDIVQWTIQVKKKRRKKKRDYPHLVNWPVSYASRCEPENVCMV